MVLSVIAIASFLHGIIGFFMALNIYTKNITIDTFTKFCEPASNSIIMIFFGIYVYLNANKWMEE